MWLKLAALVVNLYPKTHLAAVGVDLLVVALVVHLQPKAHLGVALGGVVALVDRLVVALDVARDPKAHLAAVGVALGGVVALVDRRPKAHPCADVALAVNQHLIVHLNQPQPHVVGEQSVLPCLMILCDSCFWSVYKIPKLTDFLSFHVCH